jgi:hypothetical protein
MNEIYSAARVRAPAGVVQGCRHITLLGTTAAADTQHLYTMSPQPSPLPVADQCHPGPLTPTAGVTPPPGERGGRETRQTPAAVEWCMMQCAGVHCTGASGMSGRHADQSGVPWTPCFVACLTCWHDQPAKARVCEAGASCVRVRPLMRCCCMAFCAAGFTSVYAITGIAIALLEVQPLTLYCCWASSEPAAGGSSLPVAGCSSQHALGPAADLESCS